MNEGMERKFLAFSYALMVFFIFAAIFPTLRILIIGSSDSSSVWQFVFSGLNEILLFVILLIGFYFIRNQHSLKESILLFDKVLLSYFLFNVLLGFILANDLKLSVYGFRMTYVPMLCYFAARCFLFVEKEKQERMIQALFLLMTVISGIGLVLYFGFPKFIDYMMLKGKYFQSVYFIPRMGSIFWTPISFASVAAISALYYFFRLMQRYRHLDLFYFIIQFSCLTLTVSRGALIAFLLSYLFISLYFKNYKRATWIFILMLANFSLLLLWLTGSLMIMQWIAYSTKSTIEMTGSLSRVELWRRSWNDFLNQPFGYGLGKAGHVAHRFLLNSPVDASRWSTDGWYLKLANETGFLGVLSFAGLVWTYMVSLARKIRLKADPWLIFFFSVGLYLLIQNVVSNVLDFFYFSFLFWFTMGCSVNTMQRNLS